MNFTTEQEAWEYWLELYNSPAETREEDARMFMDWVQDTGVSWIESGHMFSEDCI